MPHIGNRRTDGKPLPPKTRVSPTSSSSPSGNIAAVPPVTPASPILSFTFRHAVFRSSPAVSSIKSEAAVPTSGHAKLLSAKAAPAGKHEVKSKKKAVTGRRSADGTPLRNDLCQETPEKTNLLSSDEVSEVLTGISSSFLRFSPVVRKRTSRATSAATSRGPHRRFRPKPARSLRRPSSP